MKEKIGGQCGKTVTMEIKNMLVSSSDSIKKKKKKLTFLSAREIRERTKGMRSPNREGEREAPPRGRHPPRAVARRQDAN